uniref:Uncharacterized protein n=1 Tax=Arundo donax TaxID=35708 RepID=A0A0A9AXB4_ARUDO
MNIRDHKYPLASFFSNQLLGGLKPYKYKNLANHYISCHDSNSPFAFNK